MNVLITCYYLVLFIYVLLLLIPVTSAWGLSELWGGGISTPDISHSSPRLRRLTLHFILALPSHLFLISFLDCCPPPPSFLPPPHLQPCIVKSPSPYLLSRCKYPPHLGAAYTRHLPAFAAHPCALRHVPVFAVIPVPVRSPLVLPCTAPISLMAPVCFACCVSLCVSVSLTIPPQVLLRTCLYI